MTAPHLRVVRQLDHDLWHDFLCRNSQAGVFHTPEMFAVFARAKGHEPGLWAVVDPDGCPAALFAPVRIALLDGPLAPLAGRAVAFGGAVCDGSTEGQAALSLLLHAYERERSGGVLFTELRNAAPTNGLQATLDAHGYRYEDHLNFLIDLTRPEAALWADIRPAARRNVRKAEAMGVVVEEVADSADLAPVYEVLRAVYKRLQVPLPDISLFVSALEVLRPRGMMRVLLARVGDTPVGALTLLIHNGVMTYWYTGTLREFSAHRPADLLVWRALTLGVACGCRVFDFGGGGRPDEEYGVRDFKAKFGGELVNFGRHTCIHASRRFRLGRSGYQLVRRFL